MTPELAPADALAVIADFAGAVLDLQPHEIVAIDAATKLDADGLGADSVALLELAAAVATFFRLDETGLEDELLRRRSAGDWVNTVMRGWTHGSRRISFATSGTTGVPVHVEHDWLSIVQELDAQAELFAGRRRVVGLVGPRHIYGFLFCALLPRWLNIPFVDARASAAASLARVAVPGDLVVGFPIRWDLAAPGGSWLPDVTGVTSTGPISAATIAALRDRGLARMVEVYGSSETGGVAWRDDPGDPLRLYAHWSLRADGNLERADPQTRGGRRVVEAPDVLAVREDGFTVTGRRDGAVAVAGTNVSCARVEAVLCEHPSVVTCAVRPMRASEGARLKAFVVLRESFSEEAARPSLRAWARAHLSAPETPADIVFGVALPRDAHGKLADWPARRTVRG